MIAHFNMISEFSRCHFCMNICRSCSVWYGVLKVARRTSSSHVWASKCSDWTFSGERSSNLRRKLCHTLRWNDESQEHTFKNRCLSSYFRHVENSGGALFHLDGRFPPIRAYQGTCICTIKSPKRLLLIFVIVIRRFEKSVYVFIFFFLLRLYPLI